MVGPYLDATRKYVLQLALELCGILMEDYSFSIRFEVCGRGKELLIRVSLLSLS